MKNNVGKLYLIELSPSVRAVLLTAKALNIEFQRIRLNLFNGDHKTPDFMAINPQHTVPTFIDNDGTIICDSHAIMCYLVGKYGKDDALYPKDLVQRSLVDERLHFNCGRFSNVHQQLYYPMWTKQSTVPSGEMMKRVTECYEIIDKFVTDRAWICGDAMTIADFSVIATLSSLAIKAPVDAKFAALHKWMKQCNGLSYYEEANGRYVEAYGRILDDLCVNKGAIHVDWLPEP